MPAGSSVHMRLVITPATPLTKIHPDSHQYKSCRNTVHLSTTVALLLLLAIFHVLVVSALTPVATRFS